jgi:hypothetical protein
MNKNSIPESVLKEELKDAIREGKHDAWVLANRDLFSLTLLKAKMSLKEGERDTSSRETKSYDPLSINP